MKYIRVYNENLHDDLEGDFYNPRALVAWAVGRRAEGRPAPSVEWVAQMWNHLARGVAAQQAGFRLESHISRKAK